MVEWPSFPSQQANSNSGLAGDPACHPIAPKSGAPGDQVPNRVVARWRKERTGEAEETLAGVKKGYPEIPLDQKLEVHTCV